MLPDAERTIVFPEWISRSSSTSNPFGFLVCWLGHTRNMRACALRISLLAAKSRHRILQHTCSPMTSMSQLRGNFHCPKAIKEYVCGDQPRGWAFVTNTRAQRNHHIPESYWSNANGIWYKLVEQMDLPSVFRKILAAIRSTWRMSASTAARSKSIPAQIRQLSLYHY